MQVLSAKKFKAVFLIIFFCATGGCKNCDDYHDPFAIDEPIATERGVGGQDTKFPAGMTKSGESTRGYSGILVQPLLLSGREIAHRPFVMGYYIDSSIEISAISAVLAAAQESEPSTCEPEWRMDIFGTTGHKVVEINELCRRIKIKDRFFEYSPEDEKVIRPFLQRAVRRPTHRIVRLHVPVAYDPDSVKKLLRASTVVSYLPSKELGPWPRVKVSAFRRAPVPPDFTLLDEAAADLRRDTARFLKQYAQGLMDTKADVYNYEGPYPIEEEFGRDLRVRYGVTIYFRKGTDELTMRYHSSFLQIQMNEVTAPEFYRIDAVFNIDSKYREVLQSISKIADQAAEDLAEKSDKKKKEKIPRITVLRRSIQ